jgi:FkbM family methyltransferase
LSTLHEALAVVVDALAQGEVSRAEAVVKQLLKQLPGNPDLLHLLAAIHDRSDRSAQATVWRRRAIASAACQRAKVFISLGAVEEGRALYEEALKVDTYNANACNALGSLNEVATPSDEDSARFGHPPLRTYQTKLGRYSLPSDAPNDAIILRMKAGQVFEQEIIDALRPYVRENSVVVDVGANFGQMSLVFSEMVGPNGLVYSIEADDYVHHVLCKNVSNNRRSNVRPIFAAAFDTLGKTLLYPQQDFKEHNAYGSYGLDPTATHGRSVPTITIDSIAIDRDVSVMKVDVQGSDLAALRGARETIAKHRPVIVFEFEEELQQKFGTSLEQYIEFVRSIGYRIAKTINRINYLIEPN